MRMHTSSVLSAVSIDCILLSAAVGFVYFNPAQTPTLSVCFLCLAFQLCSIWVEKRLKLLKSLQHSSNHGNIMQNLRVASNSGSWFGILVLVAVAAEANSSESGASVWSLDICVASLTCLSGYWIVGVLVSTDGQNHRVLLALTLVDLGLVFSGVCTHGSPVLYFGVCILVQVVCVGVLWLSLSWGRGCFTLGEGMVVSQLFTLVCYRILQNYLTDKPGIAEQAEDVDRQANSFAAIVFAGLTTILLMLLLYRWKFSRRPGYCVFYIIHICVAVFVILPLLYTFLGTNPVLWLLLYITQSSRRLILFLTWALLSVVAVGTVCGTGFSPSSTITRKSFHILILAVYVPGLLADPGFLTLASVVALAVLVILEAIRVYHIPPLGSVVDSLFQVFCDEKDKGPIIVSHIYLLVGLSLPLWLTYSSPLLHRHKSDIALYSGVISLGVGDTAASVGGTLFGKHRWPGSKKTLEGTIIAVVSQLVCIAGLYVLGMDVSQSAMMVVVIVTVTSVLEGVTAQIDNLILPLFMYALFTATRTKAIQI